MLFDNINNTIVAGFYISRTYKNNKIIILSRKAEKKRFTAFFIAYNTIILYIIVSDKYAISF